MTNTVTRRWQQFTTQDLLITVSLAAVTLAVVPSAPFFGVTAAGIALFATLIRPKQRDQGRLLVLLTVLVPAEFGCGLLAYHTLGEISGGLVRLLLLLNLIFLGVSAMGNRRLAIMGALVLATCIVPYQVVLGLRWWLVHQEATAIVDFVERTRIETGEFPLDLAEYEYRHPSIKRNLQYRHGPQTFRVSYHVGTPSTSHWYDHGEQWQYYPD